MNKCLFCGKPVKNKYCNVSCQNRHLNPIHCDKKFGEIKVFNVNCKKCGKEFSIEKRTKLFNPEEIFYCSRTCANSRNHSDETKEKIKKSILAKLNIVRKEQICIYCGSNINSCKVRKFCSRSCAIKWRYKNDQKWIDSIKTKARLAGISSVKSQNRRSKNEILFASLCEKEYSNVLCNESIFNGWDADVILNDYKLAILWNGAWHYKTICKDSSLKQIQNRDRIKLKEIENYGYKAYVIEDMGKFNEEFVLEKFKELKGYIKEINFKII